MTWTHLRGERQLEPLSPIVSSPLSLPQTTLSTHKGLCHWLVVRRGEACVRYQLWHDVQRCFIYSPRERLATRSNTISVILNTALGSPQSICRVSQWPGQDIDARASKIPSQLFYSRNLEVNFKHPPQELLQLCAIPDPTCRSRGCWF